MFRHPRSVCMSYLQHLRFALWIAARLARASLQSVVHAVLPDVWVHSASDAVREITAALIATGCRPP